jgi:hypothetical protein
VSSTEVALDGGDDVAEPSEKATVQTDLASFCETLTARGLLQAGDDA